MQSRLLLPEQRGAGGLLSSHTGTKQSGQPLHSTTAGPASPMWHPVEHGPTIISTAVQGARALLCFSNFPSTLSCDASSHQMLQGCTAHRENVRPAVSEVFGEPCLLVSLEHLATLQCSVAGAGPVREGVMVPRPKITIVRTPLGRASPHQSPAAAQTRHLSLSPTSIESFAR